MSECLSGLDCKGLEFRLMIINALYLMQMLKTEPFVFCCSFGTLIISAVSSWSSILPPASNWVRSLLKMRVTGVRKIVIYASFDMD